MKPQKNYAINWEETKRSIIIIDKKAHTFKDTLTHTLSDK
jgi:hypothetical protein